MEILVIHLDYQLS